MNNEVISFANKKLSQINEAFLSSPEQTTMPLTFSMTAIYIALFSVLTTRKSLQVSFTKLNALAVLDNVNLNDTNTATKKVNESNIALGFGIDV